jgi:hypothetical protein
MGGVVPPLPIRLHGVVLRGSTGTTLPLPLPQRVFIVVSVYFVITQSGNFWIHPYTFHLVLNQIRTVSGACSMHGWNKHAVVYQSRILL